MGTQYDLYEVYVLYLYRDNFFFIYHKLTPKTFKSTFYWIERAIDILYRPIERADV